MSLTWEQRKQIGEALGWSVEAEARYYALHENGKFNWAYTTEQDAWDAYQPDVLGEVIPWLERSGASIFFEKGRDTNYWDASALFLDRAIWFDAATFSETVCALMLAVLEVQP